MDFIYQLQFRDEFLNIFRSNIDHKSESTLISEMSATPNKSKLQLAEIQVKMIFSKFETINHESEFWLDNLKTLLAHGFHISHLSTNLNLEKSYEPIEFLLCAETTKTNYHNGFFYKEANQTASEQFIKFCNLTDYPPGINAHIILEMLISNGGSLIAKESDTTTILMKRDPVMDVISGSDEVIRFLSTPLPHQVNSRTRV